MSKLSFRARALDANKSLPVYHAKDIPDLPDIASVNRVVPQMPTGMEKEEETEHHLQRAISAQQIYGEAQRLIIPTPDTMLYDADHKILNKLAVHMPKQFIHVQAFTLEDELPDYDCDEADLKWIDSYNQRNAKSTIDSLEFEKMIDTIEKGCCSRIEMFTLSDCQALLRRDEKLVSNIYDYWKLKRKKQENIALTPTVRTEKKDGNTFHDPYVAFRRRVEKMQTRKNRKNDEASYEKMLKLSRDLNRACLILEMVKLREQKKRNLLQTTIKILETRYSNKDFNGELLHQCYDVLKHRQIHHEQHPTISSTIQHQPVSFNNNNISNKMSHADRIHKGESLDERIKRNNMSDEARKRHKLFKQRAALLSASTDNETSSNIQSSLQSTSQSRVENTETYDGPDGKFSFRRKKGVTYHAPRYDSMGNWPWTHPVEGGSADSRFCYCYTSMKKDSRCIGFARRRTGRGGRAYFDRAYSPYDRSNCSSCSNNGGLVDKQSDLVSLFQDRVPPWPHFKPNIDNTNNDDDNDSSDSDQEPSWNRWYSKNANGKSSKTSKRPLSNEPSKYRRIHPYSNRTSYYYSSSINNQTFIANVASRYSKNISPTQSWILSKSRKHSPPTSLTLLTSPLKKPQNMYVSPSRPASIAPASSIYQLNFPLSSANAKTKDVKAVTTIVNNTALLKKSLTISDTNNKKTSTTIGGTSSTSAFVSNPTTRTTPALTSIQPIISRQPLSIVQQHSYISQKVLPSHQSSAAVQLSTLQTQPVSLVRANKLSISKGLTISHTPVVSNGMTPSTAGIQLAR